jgi:hypothetical protein
MSRLSSFTVPTPTLPSVGYATGGGVLFGLVVVASTAVLSTGAAVLFALGTALVSGYVAFELLFLFALGEVTRKPATAACRDQRRVRTFVPIHLSRRERVLGWGCVGVGVAGVFLGIGLLTA